MAGIYCILNMAKGRAYVGKATNLNARLAHHRCLLNQGRHYNPRLQADWTAQGEGDFKFITVANNVVNLDKKESSYLDKLKGMGVYELYNKQFPKHHKKERK